MKNMYLIENKNGKIYEDFVAKVSGIKYYNIKLDEELFQKLYAESLSKDALDIKNQNNWTLEFNSNNSADTFEIVKVQMEKENFYRINKFQTKTREYKSFPTWNDFYLTTNEKKYKQNYSEELSLN